VTVEISSNPPVLVVGTGFGCRIHVPALRAAGFDVVGLVGTSAERTRDRAASVDVPHAFTDLEDAIVRTGAKVVSVATPPHTHAPLSMIAISRGCHVLCEKPFAMNAVEARLMFEAAERAGVVHVLGHQFRWQPERAMVARAIAEGLIGRPRFLTLASFLPLLASPEAKMPRWWFETQSGGGWLGAQGSHLIDQVRVWLGEFESLSAALPIISAREAVAEDSYVLRFRLINGVEGILQHTAGAWGQPTNIARVAGTMGTVWSEGGVVKVADRSGTRELSTPRDLAPPPPTANEDPRQRLSRLEIDPYKRLCGALRAAMDGKPLTSAVPVPTFADGVAEMLVMDAIRASAASGGALVKLSAQCQSSSPM
jgi:predicted dehydrogenase